MLEKLQRKDIVDNAADGAEHGVCQPRDDTPDTLRRQFVQDGEYGGNNGAGQSRIAQAFREGLGDAAVPEDFLETLREGAAEFFGQLPAVKQLVELHDALSYAFQVPRRKVSKPRFEVAEHTGCLFRGLPEAGSGALHLRPEHLHVLRCLVEILRGLSHVELGRLYAAGVTASLGLFQRLLGTGQLFGRLDFSLLRGHVAPHGVLIRDEVVVDLPENLPVPHRLRLLQGGNQAIQGFHLVDAGGGLELRASSDRFQAVDSRLHLFAEHHPEIAEYVSPVDLLPDSRQFQPVDGRVPFFFEREPFALRLCPANLLGILLGDGQLLLLVRAVLL